MVTKDYVHTTLDSGYKSY